MFVLFIATNPPLFGKPDGKWSEINVEPIKNYTHAAIQSSLAV